MAFKKWVVSQTDKELAKTLSEECDIDPFAALIACSRGYDEAGELEQFLSDEPIISDPRELADIQMAAECINSAVESGELIAVYGDYDCDGVTATAMLVDYLRGRQANCIYYIPDRIDEGYGMNVAAVEHLKSLGVGLIVTVDNGISCAEEIALAYSLGMRVVVTDHHIPPEKLPEAEAVVDPKRADCPSSFKETCGAGVAFKLICVLEGKEPEEMLGRYGDLLTVGIIGDIMPLIYENRDIVKYGLNKLRRNPCVGLSAIMTCAAIAKDSVCSENVSFGIVPRINAAGRMGNAQRAVELLLCTDMLNALKLSQEIDEDNTRRQQIEKEIFNAASGIIEKNGYHHHRVIVVAGEGWHSGIVGIVASKITEKYGKPSIVMSINNDITSGSGRSYSGFSLFEAVKACGDILLKYGGHDLAAGMSLKTADIDAFRYQINSFAHKLDYVPPVLKLDCRLNPGALTTDVADSVNLLAPFGPGNPVPLFGIFGVTLDRITPIGGGKHLRLLFSKNDAVFQALLFCVTPGEFCFSEGSQLDLAVTVENNYYNDTHSLAVKIKAIRPADIDEDALFKQIEIYDDYNSGYDVDCSLLLPLREEVGAVYKYILSGPVSLEKIKYTFLKTIGYAKTLVAIGTLCELGLVAKTKDSLYKAVPGTGKTELINSNIYRKLCERRKCCG